MRERRKPGNQPRDADGDFGEIEEPGSHGNEIALLIGTKAPINDHRQAGLPGLGSTLDTVKALEEVRFHHVHGLSAIMRNADRRQFPTAVH